MSPKVRSCPRGATTAIFVEGGDDERMVQRLVGTVPVFFQCFDGRTPRNVADRTAAAQRDPGWPNIERVGVILDAEESLADSWALAQSVFRTLGLTMPTAPGVIERSGTWTVGGYLVPDNQERGASESLLMRTAGPQVLQCIDAFFQCTPNPGTTQAQRDKSRAQALAAATVAGGRPDALWAHVAITDPALATLRAFLDQLVS